MACPWGHSSTMMASYLVVEAAGGHGFGEKEKVDAAQLEGEVVYDDADKGRRQHGYLHR